MLLESLINRSIYYYREHRLALIHKKNLTVHVSQMKRQNERLLASGFVKTKSEVDYYGLYNGKFLAFEAKSTQRMALPLSNIKAHQMAYLAEVTAHGGHAFFIVYFAQTDEFFYVTYDVVRQLSTKQLSLEIARKHGIKLELAYPGYLNFLKALT